MRSKERARDHGEVFTPPHIVKDMLDLLPKEIWQVPDKTFLEPACGNGAFLTQILERKLKTVKARNAKNPLGFYQETLKALMSLYGIDILLDNVVECRQVLLKLAMKGFTKARIAALPEALADSSRIETNIRVILAANILHGDALTMVSADVHATPLWFYEWVWDTDRPEYLYTVTQYFSVLLRSEQSQADLFTTSDNSVASHGLCSDMVHFSDLSPLYASFYGVNQHAYETTAA